MSNENIIREIDEELRSDRARKAWKTFGPFVIAAAVLVVLGVAVTEGWNWWQNSNSARSSDQFYSALEISNGTDLPAAQKALDDVIAANHGGYPVLARFREAALLAKNGQVTEAIAAYDAISTAESNKYLRELALVLSGSLLVDNGDVAAVEQRVGGIVNPTSVFRNAAREAIGLAKYKAGDLAGALQSFQDAAADPLAGQELRSRLTIYIGQLTAEGVAPPAAAPAAEAPAAAPADAAAGDAPALETAPADTAPAADAPAMAPATETAPAAPAN